MAMAMARRGMQSVLGMCVEGRIWVGPSADCALHRYRGATAAAADRAPPCPTRRPRERGHSSLPILACWGPSTITHLHALEGQLAKCVRPKSTRTLVQRRTD